MWRHPVIALALLLLFAGAACAPSATSPRASSTLTESAGPGPVVGADVHLGAASFVTPLATMRAGQALRFVDPANGGGPHMLCLGHNQICATHAPGPRVLQGAGFPIQAGAPPKLVVFDAPGTYQITCTLHPLMDLTITVR